MEFARLPPSSALAPAAQEKTLCSVAICSNRPAFSLLYESRNRSGKRFGPVIFSVILAGLSGTTLLQPSQKC